MKSKYIKIAMLPLVLLPITMLVGCSEVTNKEEVSNKEQVTDKEEVTENKELVKLTPEEAVDGVFLGLWKTTNGKQNLYVKIRQDRLEYQANDAFSNSYEAIENIDILDIPYGMGKRVIIKTSDESEQVSEVNIDIIGTKTIKIGDVVYERLEDYAAAVKDLSPIFKEYCFGDEYSLEKFLEFDMNMLEGC